MPAATELTEETRFLHLLFEQTEGKIHVVMLHLDEHGITNDAGAVGAVRVVWQGSRLRSSPQSPVDAGR